MKYLIILSQKNCVDAKKVLSTCQSFCGNENRKWAWICLDQMPKDDETKCEDDFCWREFDNLDEQIKDITRLESSKKDEDQDSVKSAADLLHQAADSLPLTGAIVDICLWPPTAEKSSYTLLAGALRRLKDWHNAKVVLFTNDLGSDVEILHKFLAADICLEPADFMHTREEIIWRGKVAFFDKIENSCILVPGVCLYKTSRSHPDLPFPQRPYHQHENQGAFASMLPGRMLEVLDEINVASIPAYLKTTCEYKLCFHQKHSHSQVIISYLQEQPSMCLLVRLAVYPGWKAAPACATVGLSTEAWKENISADIQYCQEPEEELQDNYEFQYFVITSPYKDMSTNTYVAPMYLLQHPYNLNGSLLSIIYHQSMVPADIESQQELFPLSNVPYLGEAILNEILIDLQEIQRQKLQNLIDERKESGSSTTMTTEELSTIFGDLRLNYLKKLHDKLPLYKDKPPRYTINRNVNKKVLEEKSYDWPERLIQQYLESQKRSLSRMQSSESVPLSSPLQPCEASKTIDIEKLLKFFNQDGSASVELSPIRRRASRGYGRTIVPDGVNSQHAAWPDCKDVASHDIYYNLDKKSEKFNNHMNKIREKYVREETYSSCSSSIVKFPKCIKKKQLTSSLDLRRSPRKRAAPSAWEDSRPPESKRQKVHGEKLPSAVRQLTTIQEGESRRRRSLPSMPASQRRTSINNPLQARASDSGASALVEPQTKPRRLSDWGIHAEGTGAKKESRSERHKRKLLEIVENVLIKQGVSREEPIFESCSSRLYKVTKLFVMDLPTSRNLKAEMKKIAESQVKQVIEVDRQRQSSAKPKNKS